MQKAQEADDVSGVLREQRSRVRVSILTSVKAFINFSQHSIHLIQTLKPFADRKSVV